MEEMVLTLEPITPVFIGMGGMENKIRIRNGRIEFEVPELPEGMDPEWALRELVEGSPRLKYVALPNTDFLPNVRLGKNQVTLFMRGCDDPRCERYLPGSSVKGSIRTAILWKVFSDCEKLQNRILKVLREEKYRRRWWNSKEAKQVFQEVFKVDPRTDPFRFLSIGDALLKTARFTVYNRKRYGLRSGNLFLSLPTETWSSRPARVRVTLYTDNWIGLWREVLPRDCPVSLPESVSEMVEVWKDFSRNVIDSVRRYRPALGRLLPNEGGFVFLGGLNGWTTKTLGILFAERMRPREAPGIIVRHGKTKQGWPYPRTIWALEVDRDTLRLPGLVRVL